MTDLRKAAEMALEALESANNGMNECHEDTGFDFANEQYEVEQAIQALLQALAQPDDFVYNEDKSFRLSPSTGSFGIGDAPAKQPEQEPVAWIYRGNFHPFDPSDWAEGETVTPLYTTPPKREWVGLTDEDLSVFTTEFYNGAVWAEAKLKEKNT